MNVPKLTITTEYEYVIDPTLMFDYTGTRIVARKVKVTITEADGSEVKVDAEALGPTAKIDGTPKANSPAMWRFVKHEYTIDYMKDAWQRLVASRLSTPGGSQ